MNRPAAGMRVVMTMPLSALAFLGGHRVQMERTAQALRDRGLLVDVVAVEDADYANADVVHAFGASFAQARALRGRKIPLTISPIYWGAEYTINFEHGTRRRRASDRVRRALLDGASALAGTDAARLRARAAPLLELAGVVAQADLLLPNSCLEALRLQEDLGVTVPWQLVTNAIDDQVFGLQVDSPSADNDWETVDVLCVGRVEPHKNQLALIRACQRAGLSLRIVGPHHPSHLDYLAACRRAGGRSVMFVDAVRQQQLPSLYQAARVHALPSWYETTGLSNLEAAAEGLAVVTTDRGFAREYFGDDAAYCNPASRRSLVTALRAALAAGPSPLLRQRVLVQCNWRVAAEQTEAGYLSALGRR